MSGRIDAFAHVLPREFYRAMVDRHPSDELTALRGYDALWDMERRVADMDAADVDRQVLTLARPTIFRGVDPAGALESVRLANDSVAEIAEQYPDRFIPVATIPYVTEAYLDEFDRCVNELDMVGVQLFSNVDGRPLDDPYFHPIYERAERSDVPVWVHPQLDNWCDWMDGYGLHKTLGWPFDTTIMMYRLVLSGTMDRFPDLEMVFHHFGGMTPHFHSRVQRYYEVWRGADPSENHPYAGSGTRVDLERPVREYFRSNIYVDTAVQQASTVECGFSFFGGANTLFAADRPFVPYDVTLSAIENADIDEDDLERIYRTNFEGIVDC